MGTLDLLGVLRVHVIRVLAGLGLALILVPSLGHLRLRVVVVGPGGQLGCREEGRDPGGCWWLGRGDIGAVERIPTIATLGPEELGTRTGRRDLPVEG